MLTWAHFLFCVSDYLVSVLVRETIALATILLGSHWLRRCRVIDRNRNSQISQIKKCSCPLSQNMPFRVWRAPRLPTAQPIHGIARCFVMSNVKLCRYVVTCPIYSVFHMFCRSNRLQDRIPVCGRMILNATSKNCKLTHKIQFYATRENETVMYCQYNFTSQTSREQSTVVQLSNKWLNEYIIFRNLKILCSLIITRPKTLGSYTDWTNNTCAKYIRLWTPVPCPYEGAYVTVIKSI